MIREIKENEINELLALYEHLHGEKLECDDKTLTLWKNIMADKNYHLVVAEENGKLVSSCTLVVIPNLTHGGRPYALIENVVTRENYRGKGLATGCLHYGVKLAEEAGCYKVMLLTGSKEESTLNFYRKAGFNSSDKTAFIRWIE